MRGAPYELAQPGTVGCGVTDVSLIGRLSPNTFSRQNPTSRGANSKRAVSHHWSPRPEVLALAGGLR